MENRLSHIGNSFDVRGHRSDSIVKRARDQLDASVVNLQRSSTLDGQAFQRLENWEGVFPFPLVLEGQGIRFVLPEHWPAHLARKWPVCTQVTVLLAEVCSIAGQAYSFHTVVGDGITEVCYVRQFVENVTGKSAIDSMAFLIGIVPFSVGQARSTDRRSR